MIILMPGYGKQLELSVKAAPDCHNAEIKLTLAQQSITNRATLMSQADNKLNELIIEVFGNKTSCAERIRQETSRKTFCRTSLSKYVYGRAVPEDIEQFLNASLDKKIKKLASIKNVVQ